MVSGATKRAVDVHPPSWFIDKGYHMGLNPAYLGTRKMRIIGSAARIYLEPVRTRGTTRWKLSWWVGHGYGETTGTLNMSDDDLRRCFGLKDGLGATGGKIVNRLLLSFDAAEHGVFVREGNYLNIPGPAATGLPGDPCVSLFLTDDIKKELRGVIDRSYP